jgi:hypothetical protein
VPGDAHTTGAVSIIAIELFRHKLEIVLVQTSVPGEVSMVKNSSLSYEYYSGGV